MSNGGHGKTPVPAERLATLDRAGVGYAGLSSNPRFNETTGEVAAIFGYFPSKSGHWEADAPALTEISLVLSE